MDSEHFMSEYVNKRNNEIKYLLDFFIQPEFEKIETMAKEENRHAGDLFVEYIQNNKDFNQVFLDSYAWYLKNQGKVLKGHPTPETTVISLDSLVAHAARFLYFEDNQGLIISYICTTGKGFLDLENEKRIPLLEAKLFAFLQYERMKDLGSENTYLLDYFEKYRSNLPGEVYSAEKPARAARKWAYENLQKDEDFKESLKKALHKYRLLGDLPLQLQSE